MKIIQVYGIFQQSAADYSKTDHDYLYFYLYVIFGMPPIPFCIQIAQRKVFDESEFDFCYW